MALFTDSFLLDIVTLLITIFPLLYIYFQNAYKYWEKQGIPYEKPSIPFGSFESPFSRKEPRILSLRRWYNKHKKQGHPHFGVYLLDKPVYMPIDLEIVRCILSKDFMYFTNRGVYYDEKIDPLSAHLFALDGAQWKNMRVKLTPTFTSGKMKMMFNTLVECSEQMVKTIQKKTEQGSPVDIKEVVACFTTDVIGSCAFGLDCGSFKEEDASFRKYGRIIMKQSVSGLVRTTFAFAFPEATRKLAIKQMNRDVENFIMGVVKETVAYRENNNFHRNDFLQLLLDIKNSSSEGNALTLEQMAAQVFVFFFAGYETSSSAISFSLLELARNKEMQNKARKEVKTVLEKHGGKLSYEAVQEMKYVASVIDEALRMYPPLPQLNRVATKDYPIPGTDIILRKGTSVIIPISGFHYDEEYFPDPEKFDPERFSEENKANIKPYTYSPFGDGPRNCIGLRFGLMQSRLGLAVLLNDYEFSLNKSTKLPIELNPNGLFTVTKETVFFDVKKLE